MRLYLSSFRLGTDPTSFVRLAGDGARTAVIANAIDDEPPAIRQAKVADEARALAGLGLQPVEVDLRPYFGDASHRVRQDLAAFDAVWVRGGNVFVLRHALAESGADAALVDLLRADQVVYAGYSAGPCVLGPTLVGLETTDDADTVRRTYGAATTWPGLGVLTERVVPHVRSPVHPGVVLLSQLAERYQRDGVPHLPLRDGEALVMCGDLRTVVGRPVDPAELMYSVD